jgi:hypothetical protein
MPSSHNRPSPANEIYQEAGLLRLDPQVPADRRQQRFNPGIGPNQLVGIVPGHFPGRLTYKDSAVAPLD